MSQAHAEPRQFGVWSVIRIATVVAATAAPCGWTVGRTLLQDELAQLKQVKEWTLPETLKELGELSTEIKLDAVQKTELERLRSRQIELDDAKRDFDKQLAAVNAQLTLLKTKLNSYEGESFDLQKGESRFVIPKVLALGLSDCTAILSEAQVQFGNETRKLKPGMPIEVTFEGKVYTVVLRKINDGSIGGDWATFTVS